METFREKLNRMGRKMSEIGGQQDQLSTEDSNDEKWLAMCRKLDEVEDWLDQFNRGVADLGKTEFDQLMQSVAEAAKELDRHQESVCKLRKMLNRLEEITGERDEASKEPLPDAARSLAIRNLRKRMRRVPAANLPRRRQFLDAYKRGLQGETTYLHSDEANEDDPPREGNPVLDAELFGLDQRTDTEVYHDLYGMDFKQGLQNEFEENHYLNWERHDRHEIFISVMSDYASIKAHRRVVPHEVESAFAAVMTKMEGYMQWPCPNYRQMGHATSAYWDAKYEAGDSARYPVWWLQEMRR